jgi:extradiol dioxygenase family protein
LTIDATRVDFIAVPVEDLARADTFYGETVGLARNPHTSGQQWVEYETGNLTIALSQFGGVLALRVPDVAEGRTTLEQEDVEFAMDTFDSGVCNGAVFTGFDDNGMLLHRRYAPFADGRSPDAPRGRIDFVAIPTRDREPVDRFYRETLGLERNPNSTETWVEYEAGNVTLALVQPESIGQPFAPLPGGTIALRVPDVQSAKDELEAAGVAFPGGVIDSGVCHLAPFSDPAGNGLTLHRRYAPFSDGTMP